MVIKKNKYVIIFGILFLLMQFILSCSYSFAYEQNEKTFTKINNPARSKYQKKPTNKSKTAYQSSTSKTSPSVLKSNKADDSQRQFYLSDFPGKKESLNEMPKEKQIGGGNILWTIFSLLFVLGLIVIVGKLLYKLKNVDPALLFSGKFGEKSSNKFNILSTSSLGQGRNIHLVEINGKYLVIGSTINNINLLTELSSNNISDFGANISDEKEEENETIDNEDYVSGYDEIYKEYLKGKDKKSDKDDNDA